MTNKNGIKGLEEISFISQLKLEELKKTKPGKMSNEEFLELALGDILTKETARDNLISPNKKISDRVIETIRSMKLFSGLEKLEIQVLLNLDDKLKIIGMDENDKKIFSDKDIIRFKLGDFGELLVKPSKQLTPYGSFLIKYHVDTLTLHISNAHDYEQNFKYATRDALTGLYNRRYLEDLLKSLYPVEKQKGIHGMALMFIDLDNLKPINDTHPRAHTAGDLLLSGFADILRNTTRDRDLLSRYGGDEFVVGMPETPYNNSIAKAKSLRDMMKKQKFYFKDDLAVPPVNSTISIGVSHTNFTSNPSELIQIADKLAYEAKKTKDEVAYLSTERED